MDMIDLSQVQIVRSPDVTQWPATVRIVTVDENPGGGFTLSFDKDIPESWKWPSNPANPSENYQYTVWMFIKIGSQWFGAGFVEMWQGRAMGAGALPSIFAVGADGVQGYHNWWGDSGRWPQMGGYVPVPGAQLGIMISAGNARLVTDVTSVAERSNIVLVPMNGGDQISITFSISVPPVAPTSPVPIPVPTVPVPVPVPPVPVPVPVLPPATPNSPFDTGYVTKLELDAAVTAINAHIDSVASTYGAGITKQIAPVIAFLARLGIH